MKRDGDDGARKKPPSRMSSPAHPKRSIVRLRLADDTDDRVGYRKPPRAHQFKPGQSGNPKGRPKGRKNEATMLDELLFKKIPVRDGGRQRRMTVVEAIHRRIAEDSLKGNIKAAAFLFSRLSALSSNSPQQDELNDDDQAVLRAYAQDVLSKKDRD
jgi:hypothetical protein